MPNLCRNGCVQTVAIAGLVCKSCKKLGAVSDPKAEELRKKLNAKHNARNNAKTNANKSVKKKYNAKFNAKKRKENQDGWEERIRLSGQ